MSISVLLQTGDRFLVFFLFGVLLLQITVKTLSSSQRGCQKGP